MKGSVSVSSTERWIETSDRIACGVLGEAEGHRVEMYPTSRSANRCHNAFACPCTESFELRIKSKREAAGGVTFVGFVAAECPVEDMSHKHARPFFSLSEVFAEKKPAKKDGDGDDEAALRSPRNCAQQNLMKDWPGLSWSKSGELVGDKEGAIQQKEGVKVRWADTDDGKYDVMRVLRKADTLTLFLNNEEVGVMPAPSKMLRPFVGFSLISLPYHGGDHVYLKHIDVSTTTA